MAPAVLPFYVCRTTSSVQRLNVFDNFVFYDYLELIHRKAILYL